MADRRGVRSSSRRTTPAPKPSKAASPQAARTTRPRGTRTASRDVEAPTAPAKPALGESAPQPRALSRARRKAQQEAIADLTVVQEVDTHMPSPDAPASPSRPATQVAAPRRSLGAVSEMSGTTAISSFTLDEAETLKPRFILRHLPKLHAEAAEFLDHLVPADGGMHEDSRRIDHVHDPTSDFFADYDDFDRQLRTRLVHYRGHDQQYIHIRAVQAALYGANRGTDAAAQTGLDLILYQANLIVFAKDMIPLHENDKTTVGALRELDTSFPSLFLPALVLGINATTSSTGDSALLQETFELALELRTQLAITSLSHGLADDAFDPDAALDEVFFNPHPEGVHQVGLVRGWNTFALGGDDSALPEPFVQKVVTRITAIREFFATDEVVQGQDGSVNLGDLSAAFPWAALILRLVGWVRARNKELVAGIHQQGGVHGILERVQAERERSITLAEKGRTVSRSSPRKNRPSFGRNRRRSSGKFDPNAQVDTEVLKKLIAREGGAPSLFPEAAAPQESYEEIMEPVTVEDQETGSLQEKDDDDFLRPDQNVEKDDTTNGVRQVVENAPVKEVITKPVEHCSRPIEGSAIPDSARLPLPESLRPPQSTSDFVHLVKETRTLDKENRGMSMFERQANAQRAEFGDGFDESQPVPGPSRSQPSATSFQKGKDPQRSRPGKRRMAETSDDDNDDAFGTIHRSANVQRQRANAPKRVRIDPNSSGAPTSHQPRLGDDDDEFRPIEDFPQPENVELSDTSSPRITEEAPPTSTFDDIKILARANITRKPRRAKKMWTAAEEEALISYMSDYPRQYSRILAIDQQSPRKHFHALENGEWIAQRSQIDLKDKARVMARNMIKSGTGLRPGFHGVITPAMERQLRDDGWEW